MCVKIDTTSEWYWFTFSHVTDFVSTRKVKSPLTTNALRPIVHLLAIITFITKLVKISLSSVLEVHANDKLVLQKSGILPKMRLDSNKMAGQFS